MTPLPQPCNRQRFFQTLESLLHDRQSQLLGLLLLDINSFKDINNGLGHRAGDQLLSEVGYRIQDMLQPNDIVGRVGDDEFAIILPTIKNTANALMAATRLHELIEMPLQLQGKTIRPRVSTGIVFFPDHGHDLDTLLRRATLALKKAKVSADGFKVFHDCNEDELDSVQLEYELRQALEQGQLRMHYQPKICFKSSTVMGAESLTRWISPSFGPVPPDRFITLAEQSGLIRDLTLWNLKTALGQCALWRQERPEFKMAVNLSPRVLGDDELPTLIEQVLDVWGLPPNSLVLEITEGSLIEDPDLSLALLRRLGQTGVTLSIDDFGTGYSSLAYLKQLPVDELKIDKAFVLHLADNDEDLVLVRAIIGLARNFKLKVVAEGVEHQQCWKILADLGCDVAQGFYISQAKSAEDLNEWLMQTPWGNNSLNGSLD